MADPLRKHALEIFRAALEAADPEQCVLRNCAVESEALRCGGRRYDLRRFERIFVVGAGKASAGLAAAVERLVGDRITDGLVNVKYGHTQPLRRVRLNECAHPIPDRSGLEGAREIAEIARGAGKRDLLICVLSGGASALLPLPVPPITLKRKQQITQRLLRSGADIHQMNTVRKHLSAIKGGQLAKLAAPATLITLILSDVIGDDLDVIGSGPTVPDRSTVEDARALLSGQDLPWVETPKPGDPVFKRVQNLIVGSNRLAIAAAETRAKSLGYRTCVLSSVVEGETRESAGFHAAIAKEIRATGQPVGPPACVISGGETTVTMRGNGLGGRNQEFALAAAGAIRGMRNVLIFSAGTDGTDGPTDAAGAVSDGNSEARAAKQGMDARDYLERNDSYHFFDALGGLIKTGPTGTNVMDIRLMLIR